MLPYIPFATFHNGLQRGRLRPATSTRYSINRQTVRSQGPSTSHRHLFEIAATFFSNLIIYLIIKFTFVYLQKVISIPYFCEKIPVSFKSLLR